MFSIDEKSDTCSLFLLSMLLHRLTKTRKMKGELNIEGYRLVSKLIEEVTDQGFLAEDILWGLKRLLKNGMIVADHQRTDELDRDDYVKITASGHYHVTRLLEEPEYINNVSMDTWLRDEGTADELKELGDLQHDEYDIDFSRIRRKIQVFGNAMNGEAGLHERQASIEPGQNEPLRLIVEGVRRAVDKA